MCRMQEALRDCGGGEVVETPQTLAKPKRNLSEDLANNTLLAPCLHRAYRLSASFGVALGGFAPGVFSGPGKGLRAGMSWFTPFADC